MQQIYNELGPEAGGYNIEILGINWRLDNTAGNDSMTAEVDLPWLQDISSQGAQATWTPTYRDVVIVNARNERVGSYNLTTHNLAVEASRNELKSMLLAAAEFEDTDGDSLGDDWEDYEIGNLTENAEGDKDGDARTNFAEYAHSSNPCDPANLSGTSPTIENWAGLPYLTITFRRRLGQAGGLRYLIDESGDLENWTTREVAAALIRQVNPYDGTGTVIVTCRSTNPIFDGVRAGFLRVRAQIVPAGQP